MVFKGGFSKVKWFSGYSNKLWFFVGFGLVYINIYADSIVRVGKSEIN
jgi:hypothetical protein